MEKITQKDIDWLLNDPLSGSGGSQNRRPVSGPSFQSDVQPVQKKNRSFLRRIISWTSGILFVTLIPFFVLIRSSVWYNQEYALNGWLALGLGVLTTVALLVITLLWLFRRVNDKRKLFRYTWRICALMVLGYCGYGLMYLSGVHSKSEEVRSVYRSLHPVMRVAVATTTLADKSLVITDIAREASDYEQMGLPVNNRSLHFVQPTGYVHAIDLRTIGISEFRNVVLEKALNLAGLRTLRHTGTADHLHVYLPLPSR